MLTSVTYFDIITIERGENVNKRLKELRKTLRLNQEDFGNRLGVTKASISRLESGINNFTEQMIKSICREFNVDYLWFTTGVGEVFANSENDIMEKIDYIMTGENEFHKSIFGFIADFDDDDLMALERLLDKALKMKKADH